MLKEKVSQLQDELLIVKWYLEVMEQGVDSKEVIREYAILKKKHKILEDTTSRKIKKLQESLKKTKAGYLDALDKLK